MEFSSMLQVQNLRTLDVVTSKTFDQLLINPQIIERIQRTTFKRPTPVQAAAIPLGLLGNDLLVQAKSGTGKTLVFAILAANVVLESKTNETMVVVLAPTREIAYQIKDTIERITSPETRIGVFIGGEDVKKNKEYLAQGCSIAIGTPGRMAQLVRDKNLQLKNSKLLVFDEADKLMEETFRDDIKIVYNELNPKTTQVTAFSATYPEGLDTYLTQFMKTPACVRIDSDDVQLLGISQYGVVTLDKDTVDVIDDLLRRVSYTQVIVFANSSDMCSKVNKGLCDRKYRSKAMFGDMSQDDRNKVVGDLKKLALRILVSTDVTARGIDASNVNLVINVGCALATETYLHRIGRAGRYGGTGTAITVLTDKKDAVKFSQMIENDNLHVKMLDFNEEFPYDLSYNHGYFERSPGFSTALKQILDGHSTTKIEATSTEPKQVGIVTYASSELHDILSQKRSQIELDVSYKNIISNCTIPEIIKPSASSSPLSSPGTVENEKKEEKVAAAPSEESKVDNAKEEKTAPPQEPKVVDLKKEEVAKNTVSAENLAPEKLTEEQKSKRSAVYDENGKCVYLHTGTYPSGWTPVSTPPPVPQGWTRPMPRAIKNTDPNYGPPPAIEDQEVVKRYKNIVVETKPIIPKPSIPFSSPETVEPEFGLSEHPILRRPIAPPFTIPEKRVNRPSSRGGFNGSRNYEESSRSSFGGNRGGFGNNHGNEEPSRASFGGNRGGSFTSNRGGFSSNQGNEESSRGGFGGNRGSSFGNNQGSEESSRGGFTSNRGASFTSNRGGFGNNQESEESSRGGFGGTRGGSFTSNRGGFGNNHGNEESSRGSFGGNRGGSFTSNRGGFGNNQESEESSRGGFTSNRGASFTSNRGGFGSNQGNEESSRGGFGGTRGGSFTSNRGGFGNNHGNEESSRGSFGGNRGGFGNNQGTVESSRIGFGGNRGGFGNNQGSEESSRATFGGNRGVEEPSRGGFGGSDEDSSPISDYPTSCPSLADRMEVLKAKSFGKTSQFGGVRAIFSAERFKSLKDVNFSNPSTSSDISNAVMIMYSNEEMLAIKDSKTSEEWIKYAQSCSEWNTNELPFEFDHELRVPYHLQIRILRQREEEALRQRQEQLGITKKKEKENSLKWRVVHPICIVGEPLPQSVNEMTAIENPEDILNKIHELLQAGIGDQGPMVFPRIPPQLCNIQRIIEMFENRDMLLDNAQDNKPREVRCLATESLNSIANERVTEEEMYEERPVDAFHEESNHIYDLYSRKLTAKISEC